MGGEQGAGEPRPAAGRLRPNIPSRPDRAIASALARSDAHGATASARSFASIGSFASLPGWPLAAIAPTESPSSPIAGAMTLVVVAIVLLAAVIAGLSIAVHKARRARAIAERRATRAGERLAQVSSMTGGLAHEINNPLSTLVLNAQLLDEELDEAVPEEDARGRLHRSVGALVRETTRLRGILEDFLRYAGRMRLDPQRRDIASLVSDLVDFFHPQCDQAAVLLRSEIPSTPIEADVDEAHLKQAVLNLMLNALQAMDGRAAEGSAPRGELMVRVESDDDEVRIHVIDTGPGIPADRVDEIFRPYVTGKPGGSGLGLPTARRIVEEHGGELAVHSEPGRGSDFLIRLPRERGATPGPSPTSSISKG